MALLHAQPGEVVDVRPLREALATTQTKTLVKTDSLEMWREGQHDDLVFAVGLAAWVGEQGLPPLYDPPEERYAYRLVT